MTGRWAMSDRLSRSRVTFIVVQVIWGMTLLTLGGANEDRTPERVMRVLGACHVLQALAGYIFVDMALRLGVWIDGLHALSGFGFASANARWRRAVLADAAITSGFAACGLIELRSVTKVVPT